MDDIISASDVEKYAYCPLSWWLSVKGVSSEPEIVLKGKEKRKKIKNQVYLLRRIETKEKLNEVMIVILCLSATVLSSVSVAIYYFYAPEITFVTMSISAMWLILASFFLIGALRAAQVAKNKRTSLNLPDGLIEYIGSGEAEDIYSENYKLIGKPDYILNIDEKHIPIMMKFGRVPRGPLFSHIMQLIVYCLLMKSRYGESSPYGIIIYGDIQYKIKVTDELIDTVMKIVTDMRTAMKTGNVHRNHRQFTKCKNCSRRNTCPESLFSI